MTTDLQTAPGAAEIAPANATDPSLATSTDAAAGDAKPETDPAEAERAKESRNGQRRIDTLVRQRTEARTEAQVARREADQLRAQLEQDRVRARQPADDGTQEPKGRAHSPEDIEQLATQRAREIASVDRANERANAIFSAGTKAFGGESAFRALVEVVQDEAGPLYQRSGMPTALGEAIADSDNAHALLHHLGQNPDVAEGLRGLSAAQLGRRIARIEAEMKPAEQKPSNAPKPPTLPKSGGGSGGDPSAESPEFMAHKLKQLRSH